MVPQGLLGGVFIIATGSAPWCATASPFKQRQSRQAGVQRAQRSGGGRVSRQQGFRRQR